nr:MAG TPA: hypothetical protein [Herelleviridae sp.]
MGLYYQAVMDKSKLEEANRLQNKIENLKIEITHISNFEIEGLMLVTNHYDSYFHINEDIAKTYFPLIKERMEKELEECERLFSEL